MEVFVYQARIQDFLGGRPKFEIMRAKYWYVMVTNSDVMRGGGGRLQGRGGGRVSPSQALTFHYIIIEKRRFVVPFSKIILVWI